MGLSNCKASAVHSTTLSRW